MSQYLVLIGTVFAFFGGYTYIRDTIRGETKPNRVTWFLWAIAPIIGTIAAVSKGVTWAALPVFMAGFIPLLIFLSSFINPKAYWKLSFFDYLCGIFSLLALILWLVTKDANLAILFAVISDGLASIPTAIKAWKYPETETGFGFFMGVLNVLTSFVAMKIFNFTELAFPVYILVADIYFTLAIYRKYIFSRTQRRK